MKLPMFVICIIAPELTGHPTIAPKPSLAPKPASILGTCDSGSDSPAAIKPPASSTVFLTQQSE